jgi:cytochrome c oxidase cbb3-type subunit 3
MKNLIPSWIRVPIIFFIIFGLIEYFVDSGKQPAFITYPVILLFLLLVLLILIAMEAIVGSMSNILYQSLDEKAKARYDAQKSKTPQFTWIKGLYKKSLGSKPIEEEHEIVLDHNYDGIRELDNNLPPWWIYSFYASIIFAVFYLFKYEVFNGDNQYQEYEKKVAQAEIEHELYLKNAKDLVDYNTVILLTEASDLANGKKIFDLNCVACHKIDGGGGIGPNLTDKNWILGGGIKNVFKTVSEGGRNQKGMEAWSKKGLKPSEIAQVSSYLLQFQGTTPAEPKAAEGDVWVDESIEAELETTTQVSDSTQVEIN